LKYKITQEQELLKQTIGELAQSEIVPIASKIDWEASVPKNLNEKLPAFGLLGITIPQEFGGVGADFLSLVIAVEELSKASGSLGAQVSFHNAVVAEALVASVKSELRSKLLPKLASGSLGAFSLDPKAISCKIDNEKLLLNGTAEYVMSAASAGIYLVLAETGDKRKVIVCFERDEASGDSFVVGSPKKLLGMRASDTTSVTFRDLELPKEYLVFDLEKTEHALSQLFARARLAVAAQAIGIGQASIDAEVKYANERKQFNAKIGSFYAVRDFIAQDEIAIESARSLTYSVASEISTISTLGRDSAIAKVSASTGAVQAARHSIRVHGGYGFVRDYPVERYLRDARATEIYIESNEALKSEIAGFMLGA
jgi:alkylation response protein AidB-like acyl-CoA dehydrogenase